MKVMVCVRETTLDRLANASERTASIYKAAHGRVAIALGPTNSSLWDSSQQLTSQTNDESTTQPRDATEHSNGSTQYWYA